MARGFICCCFLTCSLLVIGCGQPPAEGPASTRQPAGAEGNRALAEFEKGITSGNRYKRADAVYALDKHVRSEAVVVDRLVLMLRDDESPFLRGAAARVLALTGENSNPTFQRKAVDALIAALDDKELYTGETSAAISPSSVRYEAATGLKAFGDAAKPAVDKLADIVGETGAADLTARIAATETVGQLGPAGADAVPKLLKALREPLPPNTPGDGTLQFHLKVIETLGAMKDAGRDAVPELVKLLKPDRPERIYAAYALGEMGAAAEPAIPELLKQTDQRDFLHFTTAMAELGDVMRPFIVDDLQSGVEDRQFRALHILMRMGKDGAFSLPQLRQTIKSPVLLVRQNSIDAILRLGPAGEAAIPELENALNDPNASVVCWAAQAIVKLKPDHAAAARRLVALLDDKKMRPHAMTGLWDIGRHGLAAAPKLEALTKSDDLHLRARAAVTLWIVSPESKTAQKVVRELLQHEDDDVRGSTASLVGRVGADAEPILDLLKAMRDEQPPALQTWSQGSIEKIQAALKKSERTSTAR